MQGALPLTAITHARQIIFSVGGDDARKIIRQMERACIVERHVERAKQLALSSQLYRTSGAEPHVLLECIQRNAGQLAIKIRGDILKLTSVVGRVFHKIKSCAIDSALDQQVAHRLSRAEQTVLNCAQRQTGNFSNFVVTQIMRMPEDDQLAIRSLQELHYRFNF